MVSIILPDENHALGDTGHTDDHNKIVKAIREVSSDLSTHSHVHTHPQSDIVELSAKLTEHDTSLNTITSTLDTKANKTEVLPLSGGTLTGNFRVLPTATSSLIPIVLYTTSPSNDIQQWFKRTINGTVITDKRVAYIDNDGMYKGGWTGTDNWLTIRADCSKKPTAELGNYGGIQFSDTENAGTSEALRWAIYKGNTGEGVDPTLNKGSGFKIARYGYRSSTKDYGYLSTPLSIERDTGIVSIATTLNLTREQLPVSYGESVLSADIGPSTESMIDISKCLFLLSEENDSLRDQISELKSQVIQITALVSTLSAKGYLHGES